MERTTDTPRSPGDVGEIDWVKRAAMSIAKMVDEYTGRCWNEKGLAEFAHITERRLKRFVPPDITRLSASLAEAEAKGERRADALKGTLALIRKAQDRLSSYLCPDGSNDLTELTNDLLYMFDGPEQREIEKAARATLDPTP